MIRKEFLKRAGMAGLASLLPLGRVQTAAAAANAARRPAVGSCTLIPSETAGPYPLDLHTQAAYFRQDIRENKPGVLLTVRLRIMNNNTCLPLANARVDLWHCDKDGYYSGYTTNGHQGSQNNSTARWFRGIQMTDANGEVTFTTIFPGWYSGRVTHIHFQVFLSSVLQATSQFTFPVAAKNAIYTSHPLYSAYGADPASLPTDNVFSDGYNLQLATLTANSATGGYDSFIEVAVNASSALATREPETGGQFVLGQNCPNPYTTETTVPFSLVSKSDVTLALYDLMGRKVKEIVRPGLAAGNQEIVLNLPALGLAAGSYLYQLEVSNDLGAHRQCKMMTAAH
jgi:protocatechuate 3,4-dioxygenase beta subunit